MEGQTTVGAASDRLDARARGYVAVLLRLALGMSILNAGILGFLALHAGVTPGMFRTPYARMNMMTRPGPPATGMPGVDEFSRHVCYVQIVVGVALVLGFFTTYAAVAAGLLLLIEPVWETISLLAFGFPGDQMAMMRLAMGGTFASGNVPTYFLVAAVVWLSASGTNPASLDAWVFHRRGARPPGALRSDGSNQAGSTGANLTEPTTTGWRAAGSGRDLPAGFFTDDPPRR
jgi:uncharacterized membrane protein YphA (DoxX/SURF4 family)